MKKILSLVLAMTMVTNATFANSIDMTANHTQMIAKTFDEFRYKMTVDVNPNSEDYQANAMADFKQRMVDLQSQGVQPAEVMNYMRASMLDASARRDFDRLMDTMSTDQISGEEAGNLAMQFMAKKYQDGASYSGGASAGYGWVLAVVGVIIVGVVAYFVIKNNTKTTTHTQTNTQTNTKTTTQTDTETNTVTNTTTVTNTSTVTDTVKCYFNWETRKLCCTGNGGGET